MHASLKGLRTILFARGVQTNDDNAVERQLAEMRRLARRWKLSVVDIVTLENVSALSRETATAVERLLIRKLRDDDFDLLVTPDLTRLSRGNPVHTVRLIYRLASAGIRVVTRDGCLIDESGVTTWQVPKKKDRVRRHGKEKEAARAVHTPSHDGRREREVPEDTENVAEGTGSKRSGQEEGH